MLILSLIAIIALLVIPDFTGSFLIKVIVILTLLVVAAYLCSNTEHSIQQEEVNKVDSRTIVRTTVDSIIVNGYQFKIDDLYIKYNRKWVRVIDYENIFSR